MSDARGSDEIAYRLRVELAILKSNQDFTHIDSLLGVSAKHYARKGESVEGRPIARQNVWAYWGDRSSDNANISQQWEPVGQLIVRKQNEIVALGRHAIVKLSIVVHAFSAFPGMHLPPDMIAALRDVGASLDFDLYGSLTGEIY